MLKSYLKATRWEKSVFQCLAPVRLSQSRGLTPLTYLFGRVVPAVFGGQVMSQQQSTLIIPAAFHQLVAVVGGDVVTPRTRHESRFLTKF